MRRRWILLGIALILVALAWVFRRSLSLRLLPIEQLIGVVTWIQSNRALSIAFYLVYALGVMALPITMFPVVGGLLFRFDSRHLHLFYAAFIVCQRLRRDARR